MCDVTDLPVYQTGETLNPDTVITSYMYMAGRRERL